jgi:radical SAM/Cys-rich protein
MHAPESTTQLAAVAAAQDFGAALARHGLPQLTRGAVSVLQLSLGKLCNMACQHCHVDAGPRRTEVMGEAVARRVLSLLARNPEVEIVELTGGAPELNPNFESLVVESRRLGKQVIDHSNLTVLLEPELRHLPELLARERVRIVASLPCHRRENVDAQRGPGAFDLSIRALQRLNALGYGSDPELTLDLVHNPIGADLPLPRAELEVAYRAELLERFGVRFDRLIAIANMPIKRFAQLLWRSGQHDGYLSMLAAHFDPRAVPGLMCRSLLSVGWDGRLYDCDFNQMLELPLGGGLAGRRRTIWDVESLDALAGTAIATRRHCFGCTARARGCGAV